MKRATGKEDAFERGEENPQWGLFAKALCAFNGMSTCRLSKFLFPRQPKTGPLLALVRHSDNYEGNPGRRNEMFRRVASWARLVLRIRGSIRCLNETVTGNSAMKTDCLRSSGPSFHFGSVDDEVVKRGARFTLPLPLESKSS